MLDHASMQRLMRRSRAHFVGYKDTDSRFHGANAQYVKEMGLAHVEDLVGRTAYDVPSRTADCAGLFHAQDALVLASGDQLPILGIHPGESGNFRAYLHVKRPIGKKRGALDGVFFESWTVTSQGIHRLWQLLGEIPLISDDKGLIDAGCYLIGGKPLPAGLSDEEHAVLFYFLRHRTLASIARMTRMTPQVADAILAALQVRFHAGSRAELRDRATAAGYLHRVPAQVFASAMSSSERFRVR